MVDMAEKKRKGDGECMPATVEKPKGPSYPYGLRVTLNKEQLTKMKIEVKDMTIGDKVSIQAVAKVVRMSESVGTYSDDKSIELQITKLSVG